MFVCEEEKEASIRNVPLWKSDYIKIFNSRTKNQKHIAIYTTVIDKADKCN